MRSQLLVALPLLALMAMSCELFFGFDDLEVATGGGGGVGGAGGAGAGGAGGAGGGAGGVGTPCSDGGGCDSDEYCAATGYCLSKVADGVACLPDSVCSSCQPFDMCVSGNCVDDVCCDSPCNGLCRSCRAADTGGSEGSCGDVAAGTDPGLECEDGEFCTGPESCDGSGSCVSAGDPCPGPDGDADCAETCDELADACTGYDFEGASCDDGFACTPSDSCDGFGSCFGFGAVCGDGVVCIASEICDDNNADDCGSCSGDCQTLGGGFCPPGIGCTDNTDCYSLDCAGGVCQGCGVQANGTPCQADGDCQSCSCANLGEYYCCDLCPLCYECQSGSWDCAPIQAGLEDPNGCLSPFVCDGSGNCI